MPAFTGSELCAPPQCFAHTIRAVTVVFLATLSAGHRLPTNSHGRGGVALAEQFTSREQVNSPPQRTVGELAVVSDHRASSSSARRARSALPKVAAGRGDRSPNLLGERRVPHRQVALNVRRSGALAELMERASGCPVKITLATVARRGWLK
jgi:hypothetical protein